VWARVVDPVLLRRDCDVPGDVDRDDQRQACLDFLKRWSATIYSTAIAAVIAIPLGILLGSSKRSIARRIPDRLFRSTPASAMFPLFLVLFGVGDRTKISVAAFGAALVILFNVAYGVMNARKTRILAARVMAHPASGCSGT